MRPFGGFGRCQRRSKCPHDPPRTFLGGSGPAQWRSRAPSGSRFGVACFRDPGHGRDRAMESRYFPIPGAIREPQDPIFGVKNGPHLDLRIRKHARRHMSLISCWFPGLSLYVKRSGFLGQGRTNRSSCCVAWWKGARDEDHPVPKFSIQKDVRQKGRLPIVRQTSGSHITHLSHL